MNMIIDYLKGLGYNVDIDFYGYINTWGKWYAGKVKEFHSYKQYNGKKLIPRERYTLGMAKKGCEDWANKLLSEKVTISTDSQEEVDEILERNNFWLNGNQLVEEAFALGTGAFVEYKTSDCPVIDYIIAPMIFPLRWKKGEIIDCAFASVLETGTQKQFYINIHVKEGNRYRVENKIIVANNDGTFAEGELPKEVMPVVWNDVKTFQIIKPNLVNNISLGSPMGISIFANAIDEMKTIDLIYDSYKNEFSLGKKRIFVKSGALNVDLENGDAVPVFDENDVEFYALPDEDGQDMIQESKFDIRAEQHDTGLQTNLNLFGKKIGFGDNGYKWEKGQVKTATETISDNSEMFRNIQKHEVILEPALIGMVDAIMYLKTGKVYTGDTSINFDDSIIEDMAEVKRQALIEYNAGIIDKVEYMVRVYKMNEDEALKKIEEMETRKPKEVTYEV